MQTKPQDPMEYLISKGDKMAMSLTHSMNKAGKVIENISKSIWYNAFMVTFFLFTSFTVLLLISPVLITSEDPSLRGVGAVIYNVVSSTQMCHQLPQRSIGFLGAHMPVDARSFAIYLGVVIGAFLPLTTKRAVELFKSPRIILLSILPIAVDGISQSMLGLRESNNALRFLTGFIFGFGVVCFLVSYILKKYPDIKPLITRKENLIVTVFAALLIVYTFVLFAGGTAGDSYLSRGHAQAIALNHSATSWGHARVYYIAPNVVASIHYDPYLKSYNDFVLSDVKNLDWDIIGALADEMDSRVMGLTGIWAVVLSDDAPVKEGKTIFTHVSGDYYYIDPVYGIILEIKSH